MNKTGYGNYAKLIAFFLVAALLIAGFGFATEGWWQNTEQTADTVTPGDTTANGGTQNNNSDEDIPIIVEPEIKVPDFLNTLTGLESTEELSRKRHYAFVLDPTSPLYGIASSDIIAEFPIEDDSTRLLAFSNNTKNLSKIGSMLPTRSYISNVAKFFGSVLIARGNDGTLNYEKCDVNGSFFNMSTNPGYYYTEYSQFTYTNGDLVDAGIYNANVNTTLPADTSLPYEFVDYGKELPASGFSAKTVIIPFSQKSETELYYSVDYGTYTFNKNGASKSDILNDKKITYKNVFVIFADASTYEGYDSSEMVLHTVGSGSGFYISGGVGQNITWQSDISGKLTFYDSNGEKLIINRGNSYIGFAKSSKSSDIKIS